MIAAPACTAATTSLTSGLVTARVPVGIYAPTGEGNRSPSPEMHDVIDAILSPLPIPPEEGLGCARSRDELSRLVTDRIAISADDTRPIGRRPHVNRPDTEDLWEKKPPQ